MNLFDSKPVISIPREEVQRKIKQLYDTIASLEKELDNRDTNEKQYWGYLGVTKRGIGRIETGYIMFETMKEAAEAYVKEYRTDDLESAYYRIHKIYR